MIQFSKQVILSNVATKYDAVHAAAKAIGITAKSLRNILRGGTCRMDAARKIIRHFKLIEGKDYSFVVAKKAKKIASHKNSVA